MSLRGRLSLLGAAAVLVAACSSGGSTPAPSAAPPSTAPSTAPSMAASEAPSTAASTAPIAGGLLDKILKAGKLVVSTDPKYPPQSELKSDGTYQGFDIDVATEIAKRLGVTVEFTTPDWSAITAGGWAGRWDVSVGSMTITVDRSKVLDFSSPYYYTPAQMAASVHSGITTLDGLAGKTICSGEGTTYDQWLQRHPRLRQRPGPGQAARRHQDDHAADRYRLRRPVEGRPVRLRRLAELDHDRRQRSLGRSAPDQGRQPRLLRAARGGRRQERPRRQRLHADPQQDRRRHACRRHAHPVLAEVVRGRLHRRHPVGSSTRSDQVQGRPPGRPCCVPWRRDG